MSITWNWRKVEDGLPPTELPLLVTLANHQWAAARYNFERLWFETDDVDAEPFDIVGPYAVTHWTTVPSPQECER